MRPKHRRDYNHGKNGWQAGNPRFGKANGSQRGERCRLPSPNEEEQTMDQSQAFEWAVRHIAKSRSRPSIRLLDVLYGPQAKTLRTVVAAMLLGRKVTGSDKEAQYGNLRLRLLHAAGITVGLSCSAVEDTEFERRAEELLAEPAKDSLHPQGL